jgi:hypothetical protein
LYVLFSDLLGLLQFGKYSEFRAYKTTETALHAVFSLEDQFRRVIALGIKTLALLQAFVRTEFDTKPATLAPILYNVHPAVRYRMSLSIQWQPPEFHSVSPPGANRNIVSIVYFAQESIQVPSKAGTTALPFVSSMPAFTTM